MNKFILAFTILLSVGWRLHAQEPSRILVISQDSTEKLRIKSYEKFQFRDSAGNEFEGTIFIPNDSQFYFIDYFKEKKGRSFHIHEIKSVEYLEFPVGNNQKRQKVYLGAIPVILILVFVPYVGPLFLIFREIYLYSKYGPGHAYNPRKHKVIRILSNPKVEILNPST